MVEFPETDRFGHIELDNGWIVSIQGARVLGGMNMIRAGKITREVWSWKENSDDVYPEAPLAYQTIDETLELIEKVKTFD